VQLQFAAWDQTSGLAGQRLAAAARGGSTPFSARVAQATIGATPRTADAPTGLGLSATLADAEGREGPRAALTLSPTAVDAAFVDFSALLID
ncbi:MAG: hypothetical protein ACRDD1_18440, partial [Planctomycetia bacterium]